MAIGWRPLNLSPNCANRMVPTLLSPPVVTAESELEPEGEEANPSPPTGSEPEPTNGIGEPEPETQVSWQSQPSQHMEDLRAEPKIEEEGEAMDQCLSSWQWPKNCSSVYSDCTYQLSWASDAEAGEVVFVLEARTPQFGWTGVGFSSDGKMQGADILIVRNKNGALSLEDMHSPGYVHPRRDASQNVYFHTHKAPALSYVNGVLRAEFKRLLNTRDAIEDVDFLHNCFYFLFPTTGGRISLGGTVSKHFDTPKVSDTKICLKKCGITSRRRRKEVAVSEPEPEPELQSIVEPEPPGAVQQNAQSF